MRESWSIFFGYLMFALIGTNVVIFYTTYKVNAYNMPFGVFVGVNNHRKTILFGCVLLCNKTTSTSWWLMKVNFLSSKDSQLFFNFLDRIWNFLQWNNFVFDWQTFASLMKKPPKLILTDQDSWITKAISKELPLTKYDFFIWHITAKFSGWLHQFFVIHIRVGAYISTSYIS